jgi:tripartite-type tricarboxylate transporter receptor subunit TctC
MMLAKCARRILAATLLLFAAGAGAQPFPNHPIRLIVPYPAGGATDFFARTVSTKMGEVLGQQVVIDNRPGAGTTIGSEQLAKSAPDGYTIMIGDTATFALNPTLYKNLRYDPKKDFAPISLTGRFALVLVSNPDKSPYKTLAEFIAYAKANPGKVDYGAPGPGAPLHLAVELFKTQASLQLTTIPYKGGADAMKDVLAGQVQVMFVDIATALPQIKGGKLRALAVASEKRIASLPDVPTVAEVYPGFDAWAWQGMVAPAGTPPEVIAKLNSAFASAMKDPAVHQKLIDSSVEPLTGTPEQFTTYMAAETAKWAKVIRASNISLD